MFKQLIAFFGLVKDFESAEKCYGKRWYLSKTLWVNALALIAGILQWKYGMVIPIEAQAGVLALLNMVLRFDTNQPLVKKESDIICNPVNTIDGKIVYMPVIRADPTGISPQNTDMIDG